MRFSPPFSVNVTKNFLEKGTAFRSFEETYKKLYATYAKGYPSKIYFGSIFTFVTINIPIQSINSKLLRVQVENMKRLYSIMNC